MARKNEFVKWMDNASLIIKIICCIPFLNIIWALYRIIKGVTESRPLILLVGILWLFGVFFTWVIDLIFVLLRGRPIFA